MLKKHVSENTIKKQVTYNKIVISSLKLNSYILIYTWIF